MLRQVGLGICKEISNSYLNKPRKSEKKLQMRRDHFKFNETSMNLYEVSANSHEDVMSLYCENFGIEPYHVI